MKKTDQAGVRETFAIHWRAMKDMHRAAPGCFLPFILYSMAEALSPYAAIWLSAQLINELASLRRPEYTSWGRQNHLFFIFGGKFYGNYCARFYEHDRSQRY